MSRILTPALQVKPRALIRRERELPISGTINKKPGDVVASSDIVATASLPGNLQILRIAEKMGIEPFEVMNGLKVCVGQDVRKNYVLCEHRGLFGLFRSTFAAPVAGRIEYCAEKIGHLGLREPSRTVELSAYLDGRIAAVTGGKSLSIECEACFIQGIFGVGGEQTGKLAPLAAAADEEISSKHIPETAAGLILYGGTRPSGEALQRAAAAGARGFITGSIDDTALSSFLGFEIGLAMTGDENISMTLIITEGFGHLPFSQRSLELLNQHSGRTASINGATQVRAGAIRPEIIIPFEDFRLSADTSAQTESAAVLEPGSRVRMIRYPWFGREGVVLELPKQPARLETGTLSRIAIIQLPDGITVTVPRSNLEIF